MCAFMYQYSIFANNVMAVALVGVLRNPQAYFLKFLLYVCKPT